MRSLKILFLLLFIATPVIAQQITFTWDSHPESSTIAGFKLYQSKQSGNFTTPVATFTGGTLVTGSIPKPSSPGRYYWTLRAFMPDPAGGDIESGNSNEVTDVIKPKEPTGFIKGVLSALTTVGSAIKSVFTGEKNLRIVQ